MIPDRESLLDTNFDVGELTLAQLRCATAKRSALLAISGSVVLHAALLIIVGWAMARHNPPSATPSISERFPIEVSLIPAAVPTPTPTIQELKPEPTASAPLEQTVDPQSPVTDAWQSTQTPDDADSPSTVEPDTQREEVAADVEQKMSDDGVEVGIGRRIVSGLPGLIRGSINNVASSPSNFRGPASMPQLPGSDQVIVAGLSLRVQRSPAEQTLAVINFFTGGSGHLDPCLMEDRLLASDDLDSVRALLELRRRCRGREQGSR